MPGLVLQPLSPEPRRARGWDSRSLSTGGARCSHLGAGFAPALAEGYVLPSASLTSRSSLSLQLKSNVLSLDCHISKYPVICEQLKAEVRCWQGGRALSLAVVCLGCAPLSSVVLFELCDSAAHRESGISLSRSSELPGVTEPAVKQLIPPCRWQICGRSSVPTRTPHVTRRSSHQHHWLPLAGAQRGCPGEVVGLARNWGRAAGSSWHPLCQVGLRSFRAGQSPGVSPGASPPACVVILTMLRCSYGPERPQHASPEGSWAAKAASCPG